MGEASTMEGNARTWEWSLPAGGRVIARLDADGTESVYLGRRLVSRAASASKPDGHVVQLAGSAYRGGGIARVVFSPSIGGCAMDIDGVTIAPSPFGGGVGSRMHPLAVVSITLGTLLVVGGLVLGVRAKLASARASLPISTDLAMTYTSHDHLLTVHYPRELAAEPVGDSGVKLEQDGGSTVLLVAVPSTDPSELLRVMLDGIREEGVTVDETSRGPGTCHDQPALVVEAKIRAKADKGRMRACTFRGASRSFVMIYAAPDNHAADEPILRAVVEGAEIEGLGSPDVSAAPEPTKEAAPAALAACKGSELTCSTDGKNLVQCQGGKPLMIERPCLGPNGCSTALGEARCDESIARPGDLCSPTGRIACSEDGRFELTCATEKADETVTTVTPSAPTSSSRSRFRMPPPPPPLPKPAATKARPPGSLVWTRPRACKTACSVRPGSRIECD